MKRRQFIQKGTIVGLSLLSSRCVQAQKILITPPQTKGPFYPDQEQSELDADLTLVDPQTTPALGEVVIVQVHLTDAQGKPVGQAMVDIWQACASGRYKHSDDTSSTPLDPNFQYWAQLHSNAEGFLQFRTVIPGSYPASSDWDRPPHIHFQVYVNDQRVLTTQMYFKGDPLNNIDRILNKTKTEYGEEAAETLVVDFSQKNNEGVGVGVFQIGLGITPETE